VRIPMAWLAELVDTSWSGQELGARLTMCGFELEALDTAAPPFTGVIVGEIISVERHPQADKLQVCQVTGAGATPLQIVCGAANARVGLKTALATVGAKLPGGLEIKAAKLRGVDSSGMLCSAKELGMADQSEGIMELPADSPVGKHLRVALMLDEPILEINVTPNRPDLLSHRGMARELATLLRVPLKPLELPVAKTTATGEVIRLEAGAACPFYSLVRIDGVTVKDSPAWLAARLESIGLRPINNVVDVTNFVLHELGQPLHAFDAAKVAGGIVVRPAGEGEKFLALDGSEHALAAADTVISDASGGALALGGVMGGADSGVTAETTSILLESAWFEPQGIRKTSRRTALSSDSSYRFERGADPLAVLSASALAVKLILELAGGTAQVTEVAGAAPVLTQPVALNLCRLDQLMGGSIEPEAAAEILERLGLTRLADGKWSVPSFRADLQRHIDLVEEIARVHGLDNVPSRFAGAFVPASPVDAAYDADMAIRRALAALGFHESQTIKLISDAQVADALPLRPLQDGDVIRVKLPLSEDHAVMRPSIVPGLVASAARNVRQGIKALRFFEMGRVFRNAGGGKAKDLESDSLSLLVAGPAQPAGWAQAERASDLYDLKAAIAALVPALPVQFLPRERDGFALGCDIQAA